MLTVLDRHLYNLNTIGEIPPGKKISTAKEFITIDEDSPLQGFYRWRAGDCQDKSIAVICREVRNTIEISTRIMESRHLMADDGSREIFTNVINNSNNSNNNNNFDDNRMNNNSAGSSPTEVTTFIRTTLRQDRIEELKKIRIGLTFCVHGIKNIRKTYESEKNTTVHLDQLLEEIVNHQKDLSNLLVTLGIHTEVLDIRTKK